MVCARGIVEPITHSQKYANQQYFGVAQVEPRGTPGADFCYAGERERGNCELRASMNTGLYTSESVRQARLTVPDLKQGPTTCPHCATLDCSCVRCGRWSVHTSYSVCAREWNETLRSQKLWDETTSTWLLLESPVPDWFQTLREQSPRGFGTSPPAARKRKRSPRTRKYANTQSTHTPYFCI
jgi:hypothetical protein